MSVATPAGPTRIEARFRRLHESGEKGLVVYFTAGDPTLEATGELLAAADRGGADVIELGVPFSDPLADGPVIQRASERALRGGTTLAKILKHMPAWRQTVQAPIILFTYFNPVLQYGLERFAADAEKAGVDGALVVDLSPEESEPYIEAMRAHHLDTVFLASPTSPDARLRLAASLSSGFFYLISRAGVTGECSQISTSVKSLVERCRRFTTLPLAVGFGISTSEHVREVQAEAEAAVVGSAVVHTIEDQYLTKGAGAIEIHPLAQNRNPELTRMKEMEDWRRRIDEIDQRLVELLNERSYCAVEIGHLKKTLNLPAWQPEREKEILRNVVKANPGPLDDAAIRRLFERIIDEARSLERHSMDSGAGEAGKE